MILMTERDFPIGERTLFLSASHLPLVAVEPAKAVIGAEIVYH
jgi:hypothetical protein